MKKVIWITGGSSGIGKAVALKFANKGWQVIISSRREEVLKDISDKNENINYLKLDIVDYEACNSVFKTIVEKYNKVDICFFSTAIYEPEKEKDFDLQNIIDVTNVNYIGTINCIKAVEKYYKKKGKELYLLYLLLQDTEDCQIQLPMGLQKQLLLI